MTAWPCLTRAVVLVSALVAVPLCAGGQDPEPSPSPVPARPIAGSVERIVERLVKERLTPCAEDERDRVPCFPVSVEAKAPEYSVAESLRSWRPDDSPSPHRPPTADEMARYRPGPPSAVGNLVSLDPVCAVRSLFKGKRGPYYLYRIWDRTGERPALRDRPLDAAEFQGVPEFRYEALGKFEDECEAVAAYRRALHEGPARGDASP